MIKCNDPLDHCRNQFKNWLRQFYNKSLSLRQIYFYILQVRGLGMGFQQYYTTVRQIKFEDAKILALNEGMGPDFHLKKIFEIF